MVSPSEMLTGYFFPRRRTRWTTRQPGPCVSLVPGMGWRGGGGGGGCDDSEPQFSLCLSRDPIRQCHRIDSASHVAPGGGRAISALWLLEPEFFPIKYNGRENLARNGKDLKLT